MGARRLIAASLVTAALVTAAALPSCGEFTILETCFDGLKNNGETDVDCGGPRCVKQCALGKACTVDHDCPADATCKGGFCGKKTIGVWKQIMPMASPPARSGHGLAFNKASKGLLLFGGSGAGSALLGDTWTYAMGAWTSVGKTLSPSARSGHALVADASRVVVFGGTALDEKTMPPATTFPNDTWAFTSAWAELTKIMTPPTGRSGAAVAFDEVRGEVVLYGGFAGQELAETWTFKGDAWAKHSLAQPPPALAQASMAFDAARKETVLFGGRVASEPPDISSKTWIWSGTDWTPRDTVVGPTARYAAAMAYDSVRQRIVLFGGTGGVTPEGDTWEWDGEAWLLTASAGPPPRSGAAMAYDPTRRHMVLFGGLGMGVSGDDGGAAATPLADTWEYYVVGDTCASADTCSTSSCVDGVCCEQASCGECEACNTIASPGVCKPCEKCDATTKKCLP